MLHSLQSRPTRVEMASRKKETYQNKAKNSCTIYFVFDLDGECKFIKTKHYSDWRNMFFLAATLVGWIRGDFVYRKVYRCRQKLHVKHNNWATIIITYYTVAPYDECNCKVMPLWSSYNKQQKIYGKVTRELRNAKKGF